MQREADGGTSRKEGLFRDSPRPTLSNQPLKAIGLICLAVLCFSGTDTAAKYAVNAGQLPVTQVVWARFIGQFVAILLTFGLVSVPTLLAARKPGWQLVRSCLLLSSTVFNFLAIRSLRLDQSMTVQFLTPLTIALLAGPLLGEWVGWRRFMAIFVGFLGVLVAIRPGAGLIEFAFLWAALGMLANACFTLLTRHLARHDGVPVTLFYSMFAGVALAAPLALRDWQWPTAALVWLALASCGLWAALGHALFIVAFRHASASSLAPFTYFGLVTHTASGYFVFGQRPDLPTILGAAVVVGSGLYLLHRERLRARLGGAK